ERLAVKSHDVRLTYDALNSAANRVAHAILEQCGADEAPIALLFDIDVWLLVSMLGVLKTGRPHIVLSPSFPRAHIDHILADSHASLTVSNGPNLANSQAGFPYRGQLLNIDALDLDRPCHNLGLPISPDHIAYLYYTSG